VNKTSIEWTDATWNPIRGCSRVSEGCRNCYAEGIARRFSGAGLAYEDLVRIDSAGHAREWNGNIEFVEKHLLDPLKWKGKPLYTTDGKLVGYAPGLRIFVNSMSDLFHENVRDEWIDKIFAVMALCPQHTFQILTKRPERMLHWFSQKRERFMSKEAADTTAWAVWSETSGIQAHVRRETCSPFMWAGEDREQIAPWPLPNVHLGVSCEEQETADKRIPLLLQTPAAVRFISAEPLLGPIDLRQIRHIDGEGDDAIECEWNALTAYHEVLHSNSMDICATVDDGVTKLDWVIAGGESGPGARPMHPDWARGLRDECQAASVPFFFKQWGEWTPGENVPMDGEYKVRSYFNGEWSEDADDWVAEADNGPLMYRVGKKAAGALLDGREWREFPKVLESNL
jgi:protein gp37